jgi:hypothetical protein
VTLIVIQDFSTILTMALLVVLFSFLARWHMLERIEHLPHAIIAHMKYWDGVRAILYLGLADSVNAAASHRIRNSWRSFP